jgi:hypothetical protein
MDVHVDKSGRYDKAGRIECFRTCPIKIHAYFSDNAIAQQNIRDFIAPARGVEHASVS